MSTAIIVIFPEDIETDRVDRLADTLRKTGAEVRIGTFQRENVVSRIGDTFIGQSKGNPSPRVEIQS
jgi:hypothetical protein